MSYTSSLSDREMKISQILLSILTVASITTVMPKQAQGRACTINEQDKAEYYAEQAGMEIIEKYGGGQDERIEMISCSFNTYSQEFKLDIEVYWNGLMFRVNKYNIDGLLKLDYDGSNASFSRTYANQNVQDLEVIIGTVIVLDTIGQASSSSSGSSTGLSESSEAYAIKFTNNCDRPVELLIRYHIPNIGWKVDGWGTYSPGRSAYLVDDDTRIETDKAAVYYYAATTDGSNFYWTGDYQYSYQGVSYNMKKIDDETGEAHFGISCSG